jgi:small subunit ribosomal protein S4
MSRYVGPVNKIARRLDRSITENGKDLIRKRGKKGGNLNLGNRKNKLTDYAVHLLEKQKVRFTYGITERQFLKTFEKAPKLTTKATHGEKFLQLLESRLDNVVFRLGLGRTRRASRQLVNHGHILVDGKKVDIPSYHLLPGQKISIKESSKDLKVIGDALLNAQIRKEYVNWNEAKREGTFVRYPERSEFLEKIDEQLIVEFYSR